MANLISHQLKDASFVVIEVSGNVFFQGSKWDEVKEAAEKLKKSISADAVVVTCGDSIRVV